MALTLELAPSLRGPPRAGPGGLSAVPSLPLGTWPHPTPLSLEAELGGAGEWVGQMEAKPALHSSRCVSVCGCKCPLRGGEADLACSGWGPWPLPFKGRHGEGALSIARVIKLVLVQPACLPGVRGRGTPAPPHLPARFFCILWRPFHFPYLHLRQPGLGPAF